MRALIEAELQKPKSSTYIKNLIFLFFSLKNLFFSIQLFTSKFFTFKLGMKIFYAKFNSITCT